MDERNSNLKYFDSDERKRNLPAFKVLLDSGLKKGDKVLDVGAGTGYFSIPAARIVGKNGIIYALDKSKKMMHYLNDANATFNNIIPIYSDDYNASKLIPEKLDFIILSHTLHEIKEREGLILNLKKMLSAKGRIVIIEFDTIESRFGEIIEHRLSKEEAVSYLYGAGFGDVNQFEIRESEYCIIAT